VTKRFRPMQDKKPVKRAHQTNYDSCRQAKTSCSVRLVRIYMRDSSSRVSANLSRRGLRRAGKVRKADLSLS
jgi:hypothetical protein